MSLQKFEQELETIESEFQNYKKRILVLEEKGFHVKIMENGN